MIKKFKHFSTVALSFVLTFSLVLHIAHVRTTNKTSTDPDKVSATTDDGYGKIVSELHNHVDKKTFKHSSDLLIDGRSLRLNKQQFAKKEQNWRKKLGGQLTNSLMTMAKSSLMAIISL